MPHAPGLKVALKRGALIAAANWPLVAAQFVAESTLKLLLAVPVLGGIFLVALLMDADVGELISGSPSEIVQAVFNAMRASPPALVAFVAAFLLVMAGGSALTFVVKAGTVAVLANAEASAGPIERPPLSLRALRRANVTDIEPFLDGCERLWRPLRQARRAACSWSTSGPPSPISGRSSAASPWPGTPASCSAGPWRPRPPPAWCWSGSRS